MNDNKRIKLYRSVIDHFGGLTATATAIGLSKSTVSGWVGYGQKKKVLSCMSPMTALTVHIETGGKFSALDLSPELQAILEIVKKNSIN